MPSHPEARAEQVERLFHETLEIKPSAHAAFLADACGGDEPLRQAVQELLDASARAEVRPAWQQGGILSEARATASDEDSRTLDRYRLLERIGTGGMGTVYKAVRADDAFSKIVAVKIVHTAPGDEAILRRFLQERQILAGLEHPNIARLLDGGTTQDGVPFLAMEYVEGVSISRYLTEKRPPLREILDLFRKICSAVAYAHRNLIVHRDLKPANILVAADGEPKLLDFGIAKLMDGSGERTNTGPGAMTPEYASPEQVLGAPITTATDVYSLGVLLFQMLTGARPYRETASALDLAEAITTANPESLIAKGGRHFDPDLENIVQMALRKEPERRYASVEQFSEDIRRYREGYPVAAQPDTRGYRMRKFAGRNKAAILAATLVLLAVAGGVAATLRQANIANRRFNDVRELANSYLFEFHDAIKDLPGATPARQLVVKRALQYLDRLAGERSNDASLNRELAGAYSKVASIQGFSMGDWAGATASFRKAISILEPLAAGDTQNMGYGRELAENYAFLSSQLTAKGDLTGAVQYQSKGIALMERLVAAHPGDSKLRETLAASYGTLGDVMGNRNVQNLGNPKASLALYGKALAIREKLAAEDPKNPERQYWVAITCSSLGQTVEALGDKPGAAAMFQRALEIQESLLRSDPFNARFQWVLAVANQNLSLTLIRMNKVDQAQPLASRALELYQQLAKDDPKNAPARAAVGDGFAIQGRIFEKRDDLSSALRSYNRAVAVFEAFAAEHPGVAGPAGQRNAYTLVAELALKMGDPLRAIAYAEKQSAIDDELLKADPKNANARRNQSIASREIGGAHELLGTRQTLSREKHQAELREALTRYQHSLDILNELKNNGTLAPSYFIDLDNIHQLIARCDKALAALDSHSSHR